ncbi:MAG TPA: PAS domain S-box protein [Spirochaetota bacterium]|nr:PAS domain S-box protein [Spirochaetota bacterium]
MDPTTDRRRHRPSYIGRAFFSLLLLWIVLEYRFTWLFVPAIGFIAYAFVWMLLVEFGRRVPVDHIAVKFVRTVIDIAFITFFVYLTGTVQTFLLIIYPVWVAGDSMNVRRVYGVFTTLVASLAYIALVLLEYFSVVPDINIITETPAHIGTLQMGVFIVLMVTINFGVHALVYGLYKRLADKNEELSRANAAIRQSEARYRTILEHIEEGYFEVDLTGRITFFNAALCRISGYTAEQVDGRSYASFMDPIFVPGIFKIFHRVYETEQPSELFDWYFVHQDGTRRIAEGTASLIVDAEGAKIGFRGLLRDITTRRAAEEALRASEEKYRNILEGIKEGYYEVDLAGAVVFCNDSFCAIFNAPRERVVGKNYASLMSPESAGRVFGAFNDVFRERDHRELVDWEITLHTGERKFLVASIDIIADGSGRIAGFRGMIRDNTQRMLAEEALRTSEEKYRDILEGIREGIYEVDLTGSFTFFNGAICTMWGRPRGRMVGLNYRNYLDQDAARRVREVFTETYRTGKRNYHSDWIVTGDGEQRYIEISVEPVVGQEGTVLGFRGLARDMTERKRAEEALRESEEKYRHFVENATDGIFRNDAKGNFLFVNPSGLRLLGYDDTEITSINYRSLVLPEYRDFVTAAYRSQISNNVAESYLEFPVNRKDGTVVWLGQRATLERSARGTCEFHGISRDITERKRAEDDLRRSEERYRTILESINEGYFELDIRGSFTFFNKALAEIWGRPRNVIMGMNYREYLSDEDRERAYAVYNEVYRTGNRGAFLDYEVIRPDGSTRYVDSSFDLMHTPDGTPVGFRGMVRDITERRQAAEALRRSEEKYRGILETIKEAYFEVDLAGSFTFFNGTLCELSGYSREELIGLNYREYMDAGTVARVFETFNKVFRNRTAEPLFDWDIVRKDGGVRSVESSVDLLYDAAGNPAGFKGIIRDITEKKRAEEALRELDRQKSDFFANISHEIRTPLTLILAPIESALQGDYGETMDRGMLVNVQRNAIRLLKLINNLLDFSKIEAGRMAMKVREADIVAFIRRYVDTVRPAAEAKGVALDFESGAGSLPLSFDAEKIDKVFMNLFSNALKFTDHGGRIAVRITADERNCYIEFADSGIGIPAEKLDVVFDRFGQAAVGANRRYEGTGIGLALAKEFVEMHDGIITLVSRCIDEHPDDHGSVFTVTLPRGMEHFEGRRGVEFVTADELDESVADHRFAGMREMLDLREDLSGAAPEPGPAAGALADNRRTVLVVDDNADMRAFLRTLLSRSYAVELAEHGEEGLARARSLRPDLIVTDVMMPVMNGYEMTRRIKADAELMHTPVIMLTARAEVTHRIEGLEFGADDYLTKPFNSKELLTRAANLITMKAQERELGIAYESLNRAYLQMKEDLLLAKTIQANILPANDSTACGLSLHVEYLPLIEVGGDVYDICEIAPGVVRVFLADAIGHGVVASLITMLIKSEYDMLKASGASPFGVFSALNDVFFMTYRSLKVFLTGVIIDIDTARGVITYSSAGHPVQYLLRGGETVPLAKTGRAVGIWGGINCRDVEVPYRAGDRLLLFTDGIYEEFNSENEEFGEDRVRGIIEAHAGEPIRCVIDALLEGMTGFVGDVGLNDDITVLGVE